MCRNLVMLFKPFVVLDTFFTKNQRLIKAWNYFWSIIFRKANIALLIQCKLAKKWTKCRDSLTRIFLILVLSIKDLDIWMRLPFSNKFRDFSFHMVMKYFQGTLCYIKCKNMPNSNVKTVHEHKSSHLYGFCEVLVMARDIWIPPVLYIKLLTNKQKSPIIV